ncbi:glycosyltransferase 87 family protein [Lentzea aerocolonigenes]|uniref:glycosyltransferase 87 family protein n=1 Tax=Lentzea aerocolonigenes TaxID=68170 RepID=UPI0006977A1C|nr:glycosyltransferase 87 family protein [Lentzea aerocolonigenes]
MLKTRSAPAVVAVAFLLIGLVGWLAGLHIGLDSTVYRAGAVAVLHGEALYDRLTAIPSWSLDLPFTYPPVAAVLFAPLAFVPVQMAWALFAAVSVLGVAAVLRWTSGPPVLFLLVFSLEPVWRTIGFGQINVLLMAMVVFDLLRDNSRWSGVLTGVAAAVKLTPLIFVLHLVVTGRFREAGRALGTFLGLQVLGFLLLPGDSLRYWGSAIFTGNNASTGNGYLTNQSFSGAVQRLTGGAPVLVVVLSVVCAVAAAVSARRAFLRGEPVVAMLVTAGCGVLVSPISWSHHWVWVVPLVGLLVSRGSRLALGLVWAVFLGFTMWSASGNVLLDNLYVLAALAGGAVWWARGRWGVEVRSRVGAGDGWHR